MSITIISTAVAVHRDGRSGFADVDGYAVAIGQVVGVTGEAPVGSAAWGIGEGITEVEQGGEVFTLYADRRACGSMSITIISAAVAVHRDGGSSLADVDGNAVAVRQVVGVTGEAPGSGTTGSIGEGITEVEQGGEVFTF